MSGPVADFWAASEGVHPPGFEVELTRLRQLTDPLHSDAAHVFLCHALQRVGYHATYKPNARSFSRPMSFTAPLLLSDRLVWRRHIAGGDGSVLHRLAYGLLEAALRNCSLDEQWPALAEYTTNPRMRKRCTRRGELGLQCYFLPISNCSRASAGAKESAPVHVRREAEMTQHRDSRITLRRRHFRPLPSASELVIARMLVSRPSDRSASVCLRAAMGD